MAYRLDTLDGMGSLLASSPESIQDEDNGKAEMARESDTSLLSACVRKTDRQIDMAIIYSLRLAITGWICFTSDLHQKSFSTTVLRAAFIIEITVRSCKGLR